MASSAGFVEQQVEISGERCSNLLTDHQNHHQVALRVNAATAQFYLQTGERDKSAVSLRHWGG